MAEPTGCHLQIIEPPLSDSEATTMDAIAGILDNLTPVQRHHIFAWLVARWMPAILPDFADTIEIPELQDE